MNGEIHLDNIYENSPFKRVIQSPMAKRCAMFGGVWLTTPNLGGAAIGPQSQNDERLDDYARDLILDMKSKNVKLKKCCLLS